MDDLLGLIKEDPGDLRIRVSEGVDGDTSGEVEVFAVSDVVEVGALAVGEDDGRAAIGGKGVFGVFVDNVQCLGVCIHIGVTQLEGGGEGLLSISVSHLMDRTRSTNSTMHQRKKYSLKGITKRSLTAWLWAATGEALLIARIYQYTKKGPLVSHYY